VDDDLQDDLLEVPPSRRGPLDARTAVPRERKAPRPIEEVTDEEPFLRTRRRVPVRKGVLPRTTWGRVLLALACLALLAAVAAAILGVRHFLRTDPHFRIDSASSIQTMGNSQLTRADLLSVFGSDIGRNIFFVPLDQRRTELEQIPWVDHATVMRILPNQLRVSIVERTPVAFARAGDKISLIDGEGVFLDMPATLMAARHFNFPVITGIDPDIALSMRTARMRLYQQFMTALAGAGDNVSQQISEVDLSDPEDVRATLPANGHELLLHFGDDNFLSRYRNYVAHIHEWQQQYPALSSIDLRYDDQVVLKMGTPAPQPDTNAQGKTDPDLAKPSAKSASSKIRASATQASAAHREAAARHKKPAKKGRE
jgi:cell division protein FtsQ